MAVISCDLFGDLQVYFVNGALFLPNTPVCYVILKHAHVNWPITGSKCTCILKFSF